MLLFIDLNTSCLIFFIIYYIAFEVREVFLKLNTNSVEEFTTSLNRNRYFRRALQLILAAMVIIRDGYMLNDYFNDEIETR